MIENIYYIRRKQEPIIADITEAAIAGLKKLGVDFVIKYEDEYEPSEVAILFGYYKNVSSTGRTRKIIYDGQQESGKKLLVFERGFLKRDQYHSAGWNGINGRADFNNKDSPSDRWKKLGIKLKPWKTSGEALLVCGQVPWDSNVQHINLVKGKGINGVDGYLSWLRDLVKALEQHEIKGRRIIFRPHPLFGRQQYYREYLPPKVEWSDRSFAEDLERAWACFAFNSNSVVEGIVEGVHGFVYDQGSVVYHHANRRLKFVKKPQQFDREAFFSDLAYAQWNVEEIAQGLFWEHLNGTEGKKH